MQVLNCLSCSEPLSASAKFCGNCGAEVVLDAHNPEIRVLTIQFIDLVGSTALANNAELEDYDDTIASFHNMVSEIVGTYRGTVLQRYGDGVLSCFGLGHDGEDSALSAIAAGLSIAKAAPERLQGQAVRVGIDSGQVMCRVGQSGTLYPQLAGLHVNRASRLQEQAKAGGVVISGETKSFLSRLADLDIVSNEKIQLKGIQQPVDVISVSGFEFVERLDTSVALLERDEDLATLLGDSSSTFALIGPAGIGKSALLAELATKAGKQNMIEMNARANLRQSALFPISDAIRTELSISPDSDISSLGSLLKSLNIVLDDQDLSILAGVLGLRDAMPVALPPEQQKIRRITLSAMVLRGIASQKRATLVFDDAHWADDESTAVLRQLIDDQDFKNRLIITSRKADRIAALTDNANATMVELAPLSKDAAQATLNAYPEISETRRENIITAAEGNPLFLLALAKHSRRSGHKSDTAPLPQTIEATFQAIINGLGPLKDVVQCVSVLGRTFTPEHAKLLLSSNAVVDDALHVLTINGILHSQRDGLAFDHILMRDAAYEMLPGKRRRELHLHFADQLRVHDPELTAKLPELLADHLIAAKAHDQIPPACIAAGIRMLMGASFDPAIHYLAHAQKDMEKQAGKKDVTREEYLPVLSLLASAKVQRLGFSHPSVLESYEKLEAAVSTAEGTDRQRMIALYGLVAHRIISGDVIQSGGLIDRMEDIAKGGSSELAILWLVNKTAQSLYSGDFSKAEASSNALKDLYRVEDHGMLFVELGADPYASVLSADVHILARKGQLEAAKKTIETAKTHLNSIGATAQLPWIHIFGAQAFFESGHMEIAKREVQLGIDLADEQNADFWSLIGRLWQSLFRIFEGDVETAPIEFETYMGHVIGIGAKLNLPLYKAVVAKVKAEQGCLDEAHALITEAAHLMQEKGEREWVSRFDEISTEIHLLDKAASTVTINQ